MARLGIRLGIILLCLPYLCAIPVYAQTNVTWDGGNGNWNTPSEWSGGVVPNNGGGKTYNVTISNNKPETVTLNLGVTISDLTLGSQATLQSAQGDSLTIASGGTLTNNGTIFFNTTGSNITVASGGTLTNNGTLDLEAAGESLSVTGTTTNGTAGNINIEGGGAATFTGNVNNSGNFATGFSTGNNTVNVTGTFTNASGAMLELEGNGDTVNVNALSNSGTLILDPGTTLTITGGGNGITDVAASTTLEIGGTFNVKNGSSLSWALGKLGSIEGSLALDNAVMNSITPGSGTLTVSASGNLAVEASTALTLTGNISNSGAISSGFIGGNNVITVSGTFTNASGANFTLYGGGGIFPGTDLANIAALNNSGTVDLEGSGATLDITGSGTLSNSGSINLTAGALKFSSSSATLTGGGTVTLGNSGGTQTGVIQVGSGNAGTLTNANNTITGYGNLGGGTLALVNQGTINANGTISSGSLTVQPGSNGMTNTGTLEATNQGTLVLEGTYNNAGGKIEALGESGGAVDAAVQLTSGTAITGGTLTTTTVGSNSGVIEGMGAVTLNGITNSGTYNVNAGTTTTLEGTITNSGSINLSGSTLSIGNSVTLNGNGAIVLSNSTTNLIKGATSGLTLTTANSIEGSGTISNLGVVNTGTIEANQSSALVILPSSAGLNNKGTLSVAAGDTMEIGTSAGGALLNFSGTTLTGGTYSVAGTLEFGSSGTSVVTDAANISLTGASARIIDFAGQNVLTNLATISSAGSLTLSSGANFTTAGNFTNDGKLTIDSGTNFSVAGALTNFNSSTDTLSGGTYTVAGKLSFAGANIVTDAANITLEGSGELQNSTNGSNGLAKLATIAAGSSFTIESAANFTTVGNFTNDGTLVIYPGSKFTVSGDLTNFNSSTDTLSKGTYEIGGTLEFTGANIVNNAAALVLAGTSAKILNGSTNGLANFANNLGSLTLIDNANLATGSTTFKNSGKVTIDGGSTMTVGGANSYAQSAGTTTVDGTLSAGGITVSGGGILGAGKLSANVTVGGSGTKPTISAGDSGKAGLLAITGTYTQLSSATMNSFIGGTAVGTQYSQLQVSGTASLAGTLTVTLASGFTPTIGSKFTVLTAASITGAFSDSTIAINSSEHFSVSYTATGVVLTVVSGPQSGGPRQPTTVAGLPRRREPILIGRLQHSFGTVPTANGHFFVAGIGATRARSGTLISGEYGFSGSENTGHVPSQIAGWKQRPWAAPAGHLPPMERIGHDPLPASNWAVPGRSALPLRTTMPTTTVPHQPVKILTPWIPRLSR